MTKISFFYECPECGMKDKYVVDMGSAQTYEHPDTDAFVFSGEESCLECGAEIDFDEVVEAALDEWADRENDK
jgi:ferredoxin-like protein FixX